MSLDTLLNDALFGFAVIFTIVGIARVVEFKAAGVSAGQRAFLIPLHILGCLCISGTMVLFALHAEEQRKVLLQCLFGAGVLILFPVHIYVGIKRRLRLMK